MSLDEKLETIMQTWANTDYNQGRNPDRTFDNAIAQIKRAFSEAGWTDQRKYRWSDDGKNTFTEVMTGQEWYDRFVELLPLQPYDEGIYTPEGYVWEGAVLAAARRAAGLEGEQS